MKLINNFLILIIKLYKYLISPYFPSNCRYLPTCSEYFIDSFKLNGVVKGSFLGIKRKLKNTVQKILKESKLIDLNYTYVIFGKNNVYKDEFPLVLDKVNEVFKKIKKINSYS